MSRRLPPASDSLSPPLKKESDCTVITDVWPTDGNTGVAKYYPDAATPKALEEIGKTRDAAKVLPK